jgi:hypothetical protein
MFHEELRNQGFNVHWFRDDDGYGSTNFYGCTLANYKEMANAGAFTVISHGSPSEHHAVYAPLSSDGKAACDAWRGQEQGMSTRTNLWWENGVVITNKSYYSVAVDTSWLATHWQPSLSNNNAIAMWSICYSANTSAGTSVKEAAGGRWRSGYNLITCEREAIEVNREFLRRMNGAIANGALRTAGSAYNDPGIDYHRIPPFFPLTNPLDFYEDDWDGTNIIYPPPALRRCIGSVQMDGDWWTTLCPAPLEINPVYPASDVTDKRKGFGCILLDTTLDKTLPAVEAVIKESGGAGITDVHWLEDSEGNVYGVGFTFDKTSDNSPTTMKAVADKIRNENKNMEGRQMDGDRVQPNEDDFDWSY